MTDVKMVCGFCDGALSGIKTQKHDDPDFAEYKTCVKCNYDWSKKYWIELPTVVVK